MHTDGRERHQSSTIEQKRHARGGDAVLRYCTPTVTHAHISMNREARGEMLASRPLLGGADDGASEAPHART